MYEIRTVLKRPSAEGGDIWRPYCDFGELDGDDERLADFHLKSHPHLHAALPGFD
jgi:hypothetical protein